MYKMKQESFEELLRYSHTHQQTAIAIPRARPLLLLKIKVLSVARHEISEKLIWNT